MLHLGKHSLGYRLFSGFFAAILFASLILPSQFALPEAVTPHAEITRLGHDIVSLLHESKLPSLPRIEHDLSTAMKRVPEMGPVALPSTSLVFFSLRSPRLDWRNGRDQTSLPRQVSRPLRC